MFGGLCFLLHDNLLVGIWKDSLVARVDPDLAQAALPEPHVRPFDITGKPMRKWVLVDSEGVDQDEQLQAWVERATKFVQTLPRK